MSQVTRLVQRLFPDATASVCTDKNEHTTYATADQDIPNVCQRDLLRYVGYRQELAKLRTR